MAQADSAVILGGARTPIGKLGGGLSGVKATQLGATAIRAAVERSGLEPEQVEYAIMGNVLSAGVGQAPARQAAIHAGLPDTCSAMAVNKVCASGLMSVILATQMIKAGDLGTVVAGGMESMSRAPHVLKGSRTGKRLGTWELSDTMIDDGLWCCLNDRPMGYLAETTATKFGATREEQDQFALESHRRAVRAVDAGSFREEITPVPVNGKQGAQEFDSDEGPRADTSLEALGKLKAAFPPHETVTAGNSSQISDGAAAVTVAGESRAKELGVEAMARIDDYTHVAVDPGRLFEAPALVLDKLLRKSGMSLSDIDLLEVNEAFSAQIVSNGKAMEWDWEKVNVNGGATALGHPIGASGARILVTLLYALKQRGLSTGVAALCHGGGGAVAMRVSLV